ASLRKLAPVQAVAVNGRAVSAAYLNDGDHISVGPAELVVAIERARAEVPPGLAEHLRQIEQREKDLAEKVQELEANRIIWHRRREEIEAECRQQTKRLEELSGQVRQQEQIGRAHV